MDSDYDFEDYGDDVLAKLDDLERESQRERAQGASVANTVDLGGTSRPGAAAICEPQSVEIHSQESVDYEGYFAPLTVAEVDAAMQPPTGGNPNPSSKDRLTVNLGPSSAPGCTQESTDYDGLLTPMDYETADAAVRSVEDGDFALLLDKEWDPQAWSKRNASREGGTRPRNYLDR